MKKLIQSFSNLKVLVVATITILPLAAILTAGSACPPPAPCTDAIICLQWIQPSPPCLGDCAYGSGDFMNVSAAYTDPNTNMPVNTPSGAPCTDGALCFTVPANTVVTFTLSDYGPLRSSNGTGAPCWNGVPERYYATVDASAGCGAEIYQKV